MSLLLIALATLSAAPAPLPQSLVHEKYQLQNGLTVILHEDHTFPQACINLWFRVGSKDEKAGRSGFAHLFEHLMFMGTERAPGSDFDQLMEAGGGWNNASTSEDRTNYFSSGPSELLPTLLWLDADRLQDLGRMMTQEKLDAQRAIVRNERRQTSENVPYGRAELASVELLYPEGHPYHHSVIGSHEDLEAATLEDVKDFFATYYVPNNCSLVVAGDFDPNVVKPLVDQLFGTLPRGNDALHRSAGPVQLEREVVHTMVDDVQFARTSLIWHSPATFQQGDAELDLAASILSDGISSRLQKKLVVEQELALEVNARQSSMLLGSTFTVEAMARQGIPLQTLEIAIDEVLSDLRRDGPSPEELARAQASQEAGLRKSVETIQSRADALNRYEFLLGDPAGFERDLARYAQATPASVRETIEKVLGWRGRLVLRVLPKAAPPERDPRDQRPASGPAGSFQPPANESFQLANGIRVLFWPRPGAPFVDLIAWTPFGASADPLGRAGLAELAADMLDEGAGGKSAAEISEGLQALGANLSIGVDRESTQVHLSALKRTLRPALRILGDVLTAPAFEEGEWKRVHTLHRLGLESDLDSPQAVAARIAAEAFFGPEHPYGRPMDGRLEEVEAIQLADARVFASAVWQPSALVIFAGGDLTRAELESELGDLLGRWQPAAEAFPVPLPAAQPAAHGLRLVLVDRPGAVQTVVHFVTPAPAYDAPERPAWELLTTILGGTFTSRLNQNLRERNGYSYGARARLQLERSASALWASSAVRTDVTGAALGEFLAEFRGLRSANVSTREAQKARASWRRAKVEQVARLGSLLGVAADLWGKNLGLEALAEEYRRIEGLGEADLNAQAGGYVPFDEGVLVLVGDESKILPQLEGLGLPAPERFRPDGKPVGQH